MSREILIAVVATMIVEEATGLSRWSAVKLARWAAKHIYRTDIERAKKRTEEWDALISKSIPTNIAALFFACGLVVMAVSCVAVRRVAVIVAALGRAYAALPGTDQAERTERRATEHRQASLALLKAASELRLLVAGTSQLNPDQLCAHLTELRNLTANTQLQAVNVALLAPDMLADQAERLADAAARLADVVRNTNGDAELVADIPEFIEFEESTKAFLKAAVTVSREFTSCDSVAISGRNQQADNDL